MKTSLCGEADCPTPYEFCEACVRADERELGAALNVALLRDLRADLRAKAEMLQVSSNMFGEASVLREDVIALFGGDE
jgi:hypothetical protein